MAKKSKTCKVCKGKKQVGKQNPLIHAFPQAKMIEVDCSGCNGKGYIE